MQQQPIDYSRKWYVMAAVAMGIFLATIDGSIVNIALPTLMRELRTDFAIVQWVVLAYLITVTTLLPSVDVNSRGRPSLAAGSVPSSRPVARPSSRIGRFGTSLLNVPTSSLRYT